MSELNNNRTFSAQFCQSHLRVRKYVYVAFKRRKQNIMFINLILFSDRLPRIVL